jgi:hypothetical protein
MRGEPDFGLPAISKATTVANDAMPYLMAVLAGARRVLQRPGQGARSTVGEPSRMITS